MPKPARDLKFKFSSGKTYTICNVYRVHLLYRSCFDLYGHQKGGKRHVNRESITLWWFLITRVRTTYPVYTHIHRCVTVTTVTTSLVTLRWMAQWQLRKHRRCFDKPLCWRVVYLFFVHHDCDVVIYCRCLFEWLVIGHTTVHCSSGRTRVGRLQ